MGGMITGMFGGSGGAAPKPVAPPTDTQATKTQAELARARRSGAALGQATNLSQFRGGGSSLMSQMYSSGKSNLGAG